MPSALEIGVSLHERETLPKSVSLSASKPITGEAYRLMHPEDFVKDESWENLKAKNIMESLAEPKKEQSAQTLLINLLNKSSLPQLHHQMAQQEPLKK